MKKLVIFGTGAFAEVAHFLFTRDSDYEVVAFTCDPGEGRPDTVADLPVVPFDEVEDRFAPGEHDMFVAVGYRDMNRIRESTCARVREKGYGLATYVSSRCTNWASSIGENTFIFEDNTLQPFVTIGNNVVLWSGNHIGHHSVIGDNCFITSHVVVSGNCTVGRNSFIGVNATLRDTISVGEYCLIGAGALIMKSTEDYSLYISRRTEPDSRTTREVSV